MHKKEKKTFYNNKELEIYFSVADVVIFLYFFMSDL